MELTEEQLAEAKAEIARRDKAQKDEWSRQYYERQKQAEERFLAGMKAKYPGVSEDDMRCIYYEMKDFYE